MCWWRSTSPRATIHPDGLCETRCAAPVGVHDEDFCIQAGAWPRGHEINLAAVCGPRRRAADPVGVEVTRILWREISLVGAVGVHAEDGDVSRPAAHKYELLAVGRPCGHLIERWGVSQPPSLTISQIEHIDIEIPAERQLFPVG